MFNRYQIVERHYRAEIATWFDPKQLGMDEYTPEFADDLDQYHYKAALIGENPLPSGKTYAPWTTNQTRFDVLRDEVYNELLEEFANNAGGSLDWYDGCLFYVECHSNPEVPADIATLINRLNNDLYNGPTYLTKDDEVCSMFDDEYHHAFDFQAAAATVRDWFNDNSPNETFTLAQLGREINNTI